MRRRSFLALLSVCTLGLVLGPDATGQESASYRLEEHVLNAGGRPADGVEATSASYRVSLDAIGQGVLGRDLGSASYRMDGGFVSAYPPPGEVTGLFLTDAVTLVWDPEPAAGYYNLYRDAMTALSDLGYGRCKQQRLATTTTTDPAVPSPPGEGYFYLVTAANRLHEEGTKGWDSSLNERPNPTPCP
jgi:hypothetical protein